jgi:hypothetical protein
MHVITDAHPDLADEIEALKKEREALHSHLERIIVRLDRVSRDDAGGFRQICGDLGHFLDGLRAHGKKESEMIQHSFTHGEAESG